MKSVKSRLLVACAALFALGAGGTAPPPAQPAQPQNPPARPAVPPDTQVIGIGDKKVTVAEFEVFLNLPGFPQLAQQVGLKGIAQEVVAIKLLAAEAQKRGLEGDPVVQRRLAVAREQVLASSLAGDLIKSGDAKKHYDAHPELYSTVRVRHVLISTAPNPTDASKTLSDAQALQKAQSVRARLAAGEDFAAMVNAESADTGSRQNGGVYEFARGRLGLGPRMAPEFENASFALQPKQLSEPVKTAYGYHIIQLMERNPIPFERVQGVVARDAVAELAQRLQDQTKPTFNEQLLNPPQPAAAPAGGAPR